MFINLTVQSENRYDCADRTQGFDTDKIVDYYTNLDANVEGLTLVNYLINEWSHSVITYGVSQSVSYIQAAINGSGSVASVEIPLSSAEILALNGTLIELVAAPGAGITLMPIAATVRYVYGTIDYITNLTADIVTSTTNTIIMNATNAFSGGASKETRFIDVAGVIQENEGLSVMMNTGNPANGDGTATVIVHYLILG